jgi:hypothetical protein
MTTTSAVGPADHVAILNLYAAYNWAADDGDGDAWGACFTEDATFLINDALWRGSRAELLEKRRRPVPGAPRQHWNSSVVLTQLEPGVVEGRAQLVALDVIDGQPAIKMVGAYRDRVVRTPDGSWRFAQRHITSYYSEIDGELYRNRT